MRFFNEDTKMAAESDKSFDKANITELSTYYNVSLEQVKEAIKYHRSKKAGQDYWAKRNANKNSLSAKLKRTSEV